jgi:hypothetical protein
LRVIFARTSRTRKGRGWSGGVTGVEAHPRGWPQSCVMLKRVLGRPVGIGKMVSRRVKLIALIVVYGALVAGTSVVVVSWLTKALL